MHKGFLFLLLIVFNIQSVASTSDMKGPMIQRVAMFIEWHGNNKKDITIGVYNDPQSYEDFKHLYADQKIRGNAITVKAFNEISQLDSLENGDILYIGEKATSQRAKIIQKLSHNGVLLVGNTRDDARAGIAVVLLEVENHYHILINQKALKKSNLRADYHLLKLAELIRED